MKKIEVKVRYLFEGTYTVAADDHNEARTMVTRDCGLVLGGNIHTTLDDDEVDWKFDVHPDIQILSYTELEKKQKPKRLKMDFSDRIETLRKDIIDAIRQLLYSHGLTEITFPEEQDDPVWVIWFDNNADPFECKVTGIQVTDNSMTVIAHEKEANFKATCHTPFELGASNIDWLQRNYPLRYIFFFVVLGITFVVLKLNYINLIVMETPQRRKLGKMEAYSLIEDYFSSGELPSVFYRRVGLSDNQFYGWRKRYLRDHPTLAKRLGVNITNKTPRNASYRLSLNKTHHPSAPVPSSADNGFARVEVSDSIPSAPFIATTSSNHGSIYELCYPNGVVLRLPMSVEISSLSELIRLY